MSVGQPPLNSPEIRRLSPVLEPGHTYATVTDKIAAIVLTRPVSLGWLAGFALCFTFVMILNVAVAWLIIKGVGIWGINIPIGWGFAIVNFVWWIGIGHAGTLISAILFLLNQKWRTSINLFAEATTLFAVACAGMFPLIHTGRPWMAYYMFPYPSTMGIWPQFRSPLIWDVFAVSTYGTVSLLFWFVGLIPDLATLRDRAIGKPKQIIYGMLAMGWRGSARHWHRYQSAYLLPAGLATPLVLSVHTVVSFDFSVPIVPGWPTTIFPPYFVAGAIYSGFAMVITLAIPIRKFYHLEGLITIRHIDNMGKVMLATGLIVAYGYSMEIFMAWYSASHWEYFMMWNRMFGPMGWSYWVLITCNIALPQLLWLRSTRVNPAKMFIMSLIINTGMWFERFVIVVTSLYRDFLPSSWGTYRATRWDYGTFLGTLGLFTALFFLFVRFLPMIPMSEIRMMLPQAKVTTEPEAMEAGV